jgi:hypothetical protein
MWREKQGQVGADWHWHEWMDWVMPRMIRPQGIQKEAFPLCILNLLLKNIVLFPIVKSTKKHCLYLGVRTIT